MDDSIWWSQHKMIKFGSITTQLANQTIIKTNAQMLLISCFQLATISLYYPVKSPLEHTAASRRKANLAMWKISPCSQGSSWFDLLKPPRSWNLWNCLYELHGSASVVDWEMLDEKTMEQGPPLNSLILKFLMRGTKELFETNNSQLYHSSHPD